MIGASVRFPYRGRHAGEAAACDVFVALIAAVLIGLVGMHGLTAPTASMSVATHAGAATHAPAHGDDDPGPRHGTHAGPVCQSAALSASYQGPALAPAVGADPSQHGQAHPTGTSATAAGGTGCGPPSRYELSILRL